MGKTGKGAWPRAPRGGAVSDPRSLAGVERWTPACRREQKLRAFGAVPPLVTPYKCKRLPPHQLSENHPFYFFLR